MKRKVENLIRTVVHMKHGQTHHFSNLWPIPQIKCSVQIVISVTMCNFWSKDLNMFALRWRLSGCPKLISMTYMGKILKSVFQNVVEVRNASLETHGVRLSNTWYLPAIFIVVIVISWAKGADESCNTEACLESFEIHTLLDTPVSAISGLDSTFGRAL